MNAGFSERTFEFCFNSEFCHNFGGMLASHPHIPSQRQEKDLGYDVEMRILQSQFTASIFIQHKISAFAEVRVGRNAKYYDQHKGPYFRFPVDNHQHNTLYELSRTKGNAYYCAPIFHRRHELEAFYRTNQIGDKSLILDPLDVGQLADSDRHNVTYSPQGLNAKIHSDVRSFSGHFSGGRERSPEYRRRPITIEYVRELADTLVERTANSDATSQFLSEVKNRNYLQQVQYLLGRVYSVSWILLK